MTVQTIFDGKYATYPGAPLSSQQTLPGDLAMCWNMHVALGWAGLLGTLSLETTTRKRLSIRARFYSRPNSAMPFSPCIPWRLSPGRVAAGGDVTECGTRQDARNVGPVASWPPLSVCCFRHFCLFSVEFHSTSRLASLRPVVSLSSCRHVRLLTHGVDWGIVAKLAENSFRV